VQHEFCADDGRPVARLCIRVKDRPDEPAITAGRSAEAAAPVGPRGRQRESRLAWAGGENSLCPSEELEVIVRRASNSHPRKDWRTRSAHL
jgi:hypothetical protein